jgi:hypothetical protein
MTVVTGALRMEYASDDTKARSSKPKIAIGGAREQHVSELITARSVGKRCGDHISKIQFGLLSDALVGFRLPTQEAVNAKWVPSLTSAPGGGV